MRSLLVYLVLLIGLAIGQPALAVEPLSYSRVIRPILAEHCFACHGPDETSRQADVRLDVVGNVELDVLLDRITSSDPDLRMPPPSTNKSLTARQVSQLREWVTEGAPYEKHWAFAKPRKIKIPTGIHLIDFWVDKKLVEAGHRRALPADPFTLIRRVSFDLTGLPPTIEEADAFAADPSSAAYEAFVEKLLASPRYGERWARRWLDLARYADTNGYEKDRDRSIWPYRDWVIRALNANMPFDQFTIAQLAGDMLPHPTTDQLVATGFHRNTMLNEEGGIDPLEFRYHAMTDRVATTGTVWLGLTTGCAQCHTHKYDPILHREYFGLMAYLDNADEPDLYIQDEASQRLRERNLEEAKRLRKELPKQWPRKEGEDTAAAISAAFAIWIDDQIANHVDWQTIEPTQMSSNYPYLQREAEGVLLAGGDTSKHDVYTLRFDPLDRTVSSLRLEALPDARLPGGGPGMTYYEGRKGDFFLSEIEVEQDDGQRLSFSSASQTYSKNHFGSGDVSALMAIDEDIQTGWAAGKMGRQVAVFNLEKPIPVGQGFTVRMHFGRHYASSLGKFRLSVTSDRRRVVASPLTAELTVELTGQEPEQSRSLREAFLLSTPELAKAAAEIRRLENGPVGTPTLVLQERPVDQKRLTRLRHRGEFTQPREPVTPGLPNAIFSGVDVQPANRLEFAQWLVSRENPLTARVVVNRHWAALFGTGIVDTVDDFGVQGSLPTHPELLDHLAVEWMERGWSLRELHKTMVTSETYKQSSTVTSAKQDATAVRLLARFPRTRLEAEMIRDSGLVAAGLLADVMYGPPVRPPQPVGAIGANYAKSKWKTSEGKDRFRRSIYTYQKRTSPFAMLTTFDAGSGESCLAKRDVSNTPLQALTLMNDPMFVEIANAFGGLMESHVGDREAKLIYGFRRLLTRPPTSSELEMLSAFQRKHGSWSALARVLLCLDESITKN